MVKGFSFWQTVIPTGCISDLVEAGLVLFIWLFGVASPSVCFFFADNWTTVALPGAGYHFLWRYRHHCIGLCHETQRYIFRNLCFCICTRCTRFTGESFCGRHAFVNLLLPPLLIVMNYITPSTFIIAVVIVLVEVVATRVSLSITNKSNWFDDYFEN